MSLQPNIGPAISYIPMPPSSFPSTNVNAQKNQSLGLFQLFGLILVACLECNVGARALVDKLNLKMHASVSSTVLIKS